MSFDDPPKFPNTGTLSAVRRKVVGAFLLACMVFAPAQTALAHGGNGGSSSDYRIEVTGFEGDATGIDVHPVELGNRMELVRTSAKEVQILGYDDEPYIRMDGDGVFENTNSPSYYANLDRFGRRTAPASATDSASPNWQKVSDGTSVRWHDHRTHWMDSTPRADVRADPGDTRVIFPANRVDLVVDGRTVVAIVRVTWLPPPPRMAWLVLATLLGCALLAALVLVPSMRRFAPALAALAGIAVAVSSGHSAFRLIAGGVAFLVAVAGWLLRRSWLAAGGALIATVLAVTHFEVYEHRLLAGWAPAVVQRVSITLGLAFGAAVVGCELVAALGATERPPTHERAAAQT
jgi:hypothetical protein